MSMEASVKVANMGRMRMRMRMLVGCASSCAGAALWLLDPTSFEPARITDQE